MRISIITLCILFLTGCAISSPQSCNVDYWQSVGESNAMSGGKLTDYATVSTCGNEAPIAYRMGFDSGLEKMCTFDKGLFGGERGQAPVLGCSDAKWQEYQEGFVTGREIQTTNQRLEVITSQLKLMRKHLLEVQSNRGTGTLADVDHERINALRGDIAGLVADRDAQTRRLISMQYDLKNNFKSSLLAH